MKNIKKIFALLIILLVYIFTVTACNRDVSDDINTTEGLEFALNYDEDAYGISGIGTAEDTDIVIPSTYKGLPVTSIRDKAFSGCNQITSIIMPDSIIYIGQSAFEGCASITSINIPDSVTGISYGIFSECTQLSEITVSENNTVFHSKGNCIINTEEKAVVAGCNNSTIPIDGSVTCIDTGAFYGCTLIANITIPNSITKINNAAFGRCTSLTSVNIPSGVNEIGSNPFNGCTSLTTITVDSQNTIYHSNGNCLIDTANKTIVFGCQTSVIPDDGSVTCIGKFAFNDCSSLKNINIPDNITSIGDLAFNGCTNLKKNQYDNAYYLGNTDNPYVALLEAESEYIRSCKINPNTKVICNKAFESCINLTRINMSKGIVSIGSWAFNGCRALTSITIPDSVLDIGEYAFSSCYSLTSINIPDGVSEIGEYTFYACDSLKNITLPNSVTSIGSGAFSGCDSLKSITIPDSVTYIGSGAFSNCSALESITVDPCNTAYRSSGNCLIKNETNTLVLGCKSSIIPDDGSVSIIGRSSFEGCTSLTSINIPSGVTGIAMSAFENCTSLTSVNIPSSLTEIGNNAFCRCTALKSIVIPDGVTSIGNEAFRSCSSITNIKIPASTEIIGYDAFSGCSALESITVAPDNAVYHSEGNCLIYTEPKILIAGCINSIIPKNGSVTNIGNYSFYYCTSLTSITIPNGVTSIGDSAFSWCWGLTSITIPDSVTSIGDWAFHGCSKLTSINIPDGVTSIGDWAFEDCSGLTSINFTGTVAQWEAISKRSDWSQNTGNFTVICTDGKLDKDGNIIQ